MENNIKDVAIKDLEESIKEERKEKAEATLKKLKKELEKIAGEDGYPQ